MSIEKEQPEAVEPHHLEIYAAYRRSPFLSLKHSSYFQVYEELLGKYRGTDLTFVEVGVLNGGSLFMWRDYFGPRARIIGIDINPEAKKWEQHGFEIHLGSQSNEEFWDAFFRAVGKVDVVLDDGGHTNEQQVVTAVMTIPHVSDGGMLIVEDTHASYQEAFGNPSRYSFMNFCKALVDSINARFGSLNSYRRPLSEAVYSIGFYESIVCLHIDRRKCFVSSPTSNQGISSNATDFRNQGSAIHQAVRSIREKFPAIAGSAMAERIGRRAVRFLYALRAKRQSRSARRYFG